MMSRAHGRNVGASESLESNARRAAGQEASRFGIEPWRGCCDRTKQMRLSLIAEFLAFR